MPRKSAASTVADPTGNISMISEASTISSPKQSHSKDAEKPERDVPKQSKKKSDGDVVSIDDLLLPRTITQRICKGVLPANTSIHRDAALALTKSATVFISLLAAEANSLTERKTIQSADVIKALGEIEMADVMGLGVLGADGKRGGRVEREVEKWEGDVRGKRRGYREKVRARESGVTESNLGDTTMEVEDGEQEFKRARIDEDVQSTGGITNGTGNLKLAGEGAEAGDEEDEEENDNEDEEQEEDEEEEDEEPQEVEDSMEMDDGDKARGKGGTLAPDGRVEVGESDDESD